MKDSYHIHITISLPPPELIGKKTCYVTKENELFSVAELIFMIVMPGRHPYATDMEVPGKEDIQEKKFPYAGYKKKSDPGLPKVWISMWESLGILRKPFYETFRFIQKNRKIKPWQKKSANFWKRYNKPVKRKNTAYWGYQLSLYISRLEKSNHRKPLQIYTESLKNTDSETDDSSVFGVNADFKDLHNMTVQAQEHQKKQ